VSVKTIGDVPALPAAEWDRYARIDREHVIHSWAVQDEYAPSMVVRAEGNYFWDQDGRRYLDFTSQAWFANIGHGNQRVAEAIARQAQEPAPIYAAGTPPKLDLTEKLLSLVPPDYERVFFGCNGSDAIEASLKVARMITGRQNVVAFWHEYHGASMGATSVTGIPTWRTELGEPVPGTIFVAGPHRYRCPLPNATQEDADRWSVENLRQTIEYVGADTIAAVIGEPFVTGSAAVVPGRDYWRQVRQVCDEHGILLIGDEVVSGFGRTGHWFGRDYYDYEPDMIVFAKGLTSGYLPLSAAIFRTNVVDGFRSRLLPHGLTYSGHPICCAAALANIAVIEEDDLVANAAAMGRRLADGMDWLVERHPSIGEARSLGLFGVLELVQDRETKAAFPADLALGGDIPAGGSVAQQVGAAMRQRGIILTGGSLLRAKRAADVIDSLRFAPPLTITADEIDLFYETLDPILDRVDEHVA
jgi:taurine--2-oxoglutarate transaminase